MEKMKNKIYNENYRIRSMKWDLDDNLLIFIIKNLDNGENIIYKYKTLPTWLRTWMFLDDYFFYKKTKQFTIKVPAIEIY